MTDSPAGSLRDQTAEAIRGWTVVNAGGPPMLRRDVEIVAHNTDSLTDAVLAVFQPVLDKQTAEIEQLLEANAQGGKLITRLKTEAADADRTYAEMEAHHLAEIERLKGESRTEKLNHIATLLTLLESSRAWETFARRLYTAWWSARIGRAKARERADTYEQAFRKVCEAEGIREGHLDLMTQMRDSERSLASDWQDKAIDLATQADLAMARAESAEAALADAENRHSRQLADRDEEIVEAGRQIAKLHDERERAETALTRVEQLLAKAEGRTSFAVMFGGKPFSALVDAAEVRAALNPPEEGDHA